MEEENDSQIKKIEPLKREEVYARNYLGYVTDTFEGYRYPNNKELMDKINEIIDFINKNRN